MIVDAWRRSWRARRRVTPTQARPERNRLLPSFTPLSICFNLSPRVQLEHGTGISCATQLRPDSARLGSEVTLTSAVFPAVRDFPFISMASAASPLAMVAAELSVARSANHVVQPIEVVRRVRTKYVGESMRINEYTAVATLGQGSFANEVILCKREKNGQSQLVAIKCFSKSRLLKKRDIRRSRGRTIVITALDRVQSEIQIMRSLQQPSMILPTAAAQNCGPLLAGQEHVVSLLALLSEPSSDDLYLALEYVDGGVLMEYDEDDQCFRSRLTGGVLPIDVARQVMIDIMKGLRFLHSRRVAHRDLKPDNILVSSSGLVKIADLGVAHMFPQSFAQLGASASSSGGGGNRIGVADGSDPGRPAPSVSGAQQQQPATNFLGFAADRTSDDETGEFFDGNEDDEDTDDVVDAEASDDESGEETDSVRRGGGGGGAGTGDGVAYSQPRLASSLLVDRTLRPVPEHDNEAATATGTSAPTHSTSRSPSRTSFSSSLPASATVAILLNPVNRGGRSLSGAAARVRFGSIDAASSAGAGGSASAAAGTGEAPDNVDLASASPTSPFAIASSGELPAGGLALPPPMPMWTSSNPAAAASQQASQAQPAQQQGRQPILAGSSSVGSGPKSVGSKDSRRSKRSAKSRKGSKPPGWVTDTAGTFMFLCPEACAGGGYSAYSADVWAAGVVLYCMLFGVVPFGRRCDNPMDLFQQIQQGSLLPLPTELAADPTALASDLDLHDFLKRILAKDAADRLTVDQALAHPFLAKYCYSDGKSSGAEATTQQSDVSSAMAPAAACAVSVISAPDVGEAVKVVPRTAFPRIDIDSLPRYLSPELAVMSTMRDGRATNSGISGSSTGSGTALGEQNVHHDQNGSAAASGASAASGFGSVAPGSVGLSASDAMRELERLVGTDSPTFNSNLANGDAGRVAAQTNTANPASQQNGGKPPSGLKSASSFPSTASDSHRNSGSGGSKRSSPFMRRAFAGRRGSSDLSGQSSSTSAVDDLESASAPIIVQGWMVKRGRQLKSWHRRFFRLRAAVAIPQPRPPPGSSGLGSGAEAQGSITSSDGKLGRDVAQDGSISASASSSSGANHTGSSNNNNNSSSGSAHEPRSQSPYRVARLEYWDDDPRPHERSSRAKRISSQSQTLPGASAVGQAATIPAAIGASVSNARAQPATQQQQLATPQLQPPARDWYAPSTASPLPSPASLTAAVVVMPARSSIGSATMLTAIDGIPIARAPSPAASVGTAASRSPAASFAASAAPGLNADGASSAPIAGAGGTNTGAGAGPVSAASASAPVPAPAHGTGGNTSASGSGGGGGMAAAVAETVERAARAVSDRLQPMLSRLSRAASGAARPRSNSRAGGNGSGGRSRTRSRSGSHVRNETSLERSAERGGGGGSDAEGPSHTAGGGHSHLHAGAGIGSNYSSDASDTDHDVPAPRLRGTMEIRDITSVTPAPKPEKPHRFFISTPGRSLYLQAETEEEQKLWMEAFQALVAANLLVLQSKLHASSRRSGSPGPAAAAVTSAGTAGTAPKQSTNGTTATSADGAVRIEASAVIDHSGAKAPVVASIERPAFTSVEKDQVEKLRTSSASSMTAQSTDYSAVTTGAGTLAAADRDASAVVESR